ncbi:MAG TPA: hypothetical protein P5056_02095, partial [Candidatus Paceibacterota bacterium]|nr:hypothetical protein [Candidatus Paceibacterota bacterium]
ERHEIGFDWPDTKDIFAVGDVTCKYLPGGGDIASATGANPSRQAATRINVRYFLRLNIP